MSPDECRDALIDNTERKWSNGKTWKKTNKNFEGQVEGSNFKFYANGVRSFCRVGVLILEGEIYKSNMGSEITFTARLTIPSILFFAVIFLTLLAQSIATVFSEGMLSREFLIVSAFLLLIPSMVYSGFTTLRSQSIKILGKMVAANNGN